MQTPSGARTGRHSGILCRVPLDASTIISLIAALGIGSLIGQWYTASKDRRTARAAVLKELAAVEEARWRYLDASAADSPRLSDAIRQLEIAALVARVPRAAVLPYVQLATAGLWIVQDEIELRDSPPEEVGLAIDVAYAVLDAAEIVSKAAWSSPATRWVWLRWRIRRLGRAVATIENDDARIKRKIEDARKFVR